MLMIAAAGVQAAGAGFSVAGKIGQGRAMRRSTLMQQWNLQQDQAMVGQETTFEQAKVDDQLDKVLGAQGNYFAANNVDPTWGSPALAAAESTAAAETDKLLIGARGAQKRAGIAGQIEGAVSQTEDKRRALGIGIAGDFLNLASSWLSLGMNAQKFGVGGSKSATAPDAGGSMPIGTVGRGTTWATGGMGRW